MALFSPLKVGNNTITSRIVLSPLTRIRAPDSFISDEAIEYYRARAAAAPGTFLIAEATAIAPQAILYANTPGIWLKEHIEKWKKITAAVHEEKSFIFLQLSATGRILDANTAKKFGDYDVVGPSDIAKEGAAKPRALTVPEIEEYVQFYAQAAKNAVEAGFDGVEIQASTGFLIDQFLHENVNNRTDQYGGSIEKRSKFALDIVDAVTAAIGAEKTGIRISPWSDIHGIDPGVSPIPQFSHLIAELEKRAKQGSELAFIDLIEPRIQVLGDLGTYGGTPRHLNDFVRAIWSGVLLRCGAFGKDVEEMKAMAEADDKLAFGVGRLFISNPDLVVKIKNGTEVDNYDRSTFYWDGTYPIEKGYTKDYVLKNA